ncbi:hypothetical protein COCON_G00119910 [Conger conger]|uniref:Uncharacterized protein n=1 Tax=Conger conger TaxID=82655 RepID=A0A9Q1DGK9_CONCO|nr:uncharacterized protein LOC133134786 [Conger conger]XP_061107167.1 uncharacterized protein LOC133134786 [Conger conger]XP_061107168.1 uncharacterized protein LOC133134786 [Conger conger]KAJ8269384.1 hypothetical protein COCON_G00119910 [Conger conger]
MVFWIIMCTVLSLDLSLAWYQNENVCFGQDFIIKGQYLNRKYTVVSFTPSSPPGPNRIVFQNNTVQDPRYELENARFRVRDVTEKDEGKFTVQIGREGITLDRITLKVKDCSQREHLNYGDDFRLELLDSVAVLQFSHKDSPSQFVTLWNKTHPTEGTGKRGRVRGRYWLADKVTFADQGSYIQRNKEGRFISRQHLNIQARGDTFFTPNGDSVVFPLKLLPSQVQLYFEPTDGNGKQQLVRNGRVLLPKYEYRLTVEEDRMEIDELGSSDSGIYQIVDADGNVVYFAEVTVEGPTYFKYLPLLGFLIFGVIMCFCMKKICCKKSAQAPAQPVVYGEVSSSTNPLNPSVPSQPQWSGTHANVPSQPKSNWKPGPSTEPYFALMSSASRPSPATKRASSHVTQEAEGMDATPPSFPISSDILRSSDAGIQFDIGKSRNTGNYFSTLPLNTDSTEIGSVYNSDKLNFL